MPTLMSKLLIQNVQGLGTSNKHLRRLIMKFGINLLALAKPFFKEKSIHRFYQIFKFYDFCTNESLGGSYGFYGKMSTLLL